MALANGSALSEDRSQHYRIRHGRVNLGGGGARPSPKGRGASKTAGDSRSAGSRNACKIS